MSDAEGLNPDFVNLTANIVSAYVANNSVHRGELSNLIASVHSALQGLGAPPPATEQPKPEPAVSIRRSVTPDYLISLEDGRQYKSLKRHLATRGMTPDEYRAKWGLPKDYPMVAANYAAKRSELARSIGLGQSRRKVVAADEGANAAAPGPVETGEAASEAPQPKKRARKAQAAE
jgi:predicted transcriptional regulator